MPCRAVPVACRALARRATPCRAGTRTTETILGAKGTNRINTPIHFSSFFPSSFSSSSAGPCGLGPDRRALKVAAQNNRLLSTGKKKSACRRRNKQLTAFRSSSSSSSVGRQRVNGSVGPHDKGQRHDGQRQQLAGPPPAQTRGPGGPAGPGGAVTAPGGR